MKTLVGDDAFDCTDDQLNSDHLPWQIARLNKTQSLVIAPCWMAPYNGGSKFWLVDNLMKRPAQLIDVGVANDYQDGAIALYGLCAGVAWGIAGPPNRGNGMAKPLCTVLKAGLDAVVISAVVAHGIFRCEYQPLNSVHSVNGPRLTRAVTPISAGSATGRYVYVLN